MIKTSLKPLAWALLGSLALSTPARADLTEELRAELQSQRARLEQLEKKLAEATAAAQQAQASARESAAAATQVATQAAAQPAKATAAGGMPAGLSIYGIADAGVEYANYGQGAKTRVQSGLGSASRLGFKGERSFGDDLKAYFQLEAGVSIDNGQNTGHSSNISNPGQGAASSSAPNTTGVAIFSRNTFVGLKGRYGDIRFGRDYAPIYLLASASDPFTIGGATAFRLWSSAAASRFDNGVFYTSPSFSGWQAALAYSAGMENNSRSEVGVTGASTSIGPKDEGKGESASLSYRQGPLYAAVGYLSFLRQGTVTTPATENIRRRSRNLAATYDLPWGKLYAQYLLGEDNQEGAGKKLDRRVWWLGASVPLKDRHTLRAVYGHLDDRMSTDRDSTHYGLGYEYALDKQTDLYAYYAQVSNQNGGKNSLCAGGSCQGYDGDTNLPANFTPKSLMMGARYRF
ncbi:MAG: porin [Zoogloea sp.]|uniref:porin n=1 Tax=Zoogloea sp. TaxID=49181 RepID=UPI003F40D787|nr:porin [Rhodocyclales bacterium]